MINFKNDTLVINKTSDVKYVAQLSNFDRKFVFQRSFINSNEVKTHNNSLIIEFGMVDKKAEKRYFVVDSKEKTIVEKTYKEVKAMADADRADFGYKYFR